LSTNNHRKIAYGEDLEGLFLPHCLLSIATRCLELAAGLCLLYLSTGRGFSPEDRNGGIGGGIGDGIGGGICDGIGGGAAGFIAGLHHLGVVAVEAEAPLGTIVIVQPRR
jgi:hypothetical protein